MTCGDNGCPYEATRDLNGRKFCDIHYFERTAPAVRKVLRTTDRDAHTSDMFEGE